MQRVYVEWAASWSQGGVNILICQLSLQHMARHCVDM